MGFQEEQAPYKKVAIEFATYLVNREYKKAFNMLSLDQQKKYTAILLEKNMNEMTDYFEDNKNIWVETESMDEYGATSDKRIYVSIAEDCNLEAITVDICYEDEKACIGNIEWGRP